MGLRGLKCSWGKSAILLSKTATFILVQAEKIVLKKCHLVFVTSIQFFVLVIAEAYILFLAFQDKLLSEGHYYVFLKEEQRRPSKCFTTLSWGGGTGNGLFQGFPRAFLGLEQAGSPQVRTQSLAVFTSPHVILIHTQTPLTRLLLIQ